MIAIDKDRPSEEWMAAIRKQFVTETEIDRSLTRKLERRSGPSYTPLTLEEIIVGLRRLIEAKGVVKFAVEDARWLSGGASKLQVAFTLDWDRLAVGREKTRMVLRLEPAESLHETSRLREFQVVSALQDILPIPAVYWVDTEAEYLPYAGLVYGFASGVAKPSEAQSGVSGLGTRLPLELRKKLGPQFVRDLAKLHTFDFSQANLTAFDQPELGTQNSDWAVAWWDRVWEEDSGEQVPLMSLTSAWLRKNAPSVDHLSIVHGDYRVGNFLFDEQSATITSWLDWELTRIGDRHQDLAWSTSRAFGSFAEDGTTFLVSGLIPEQEFFEAYEKASGLSVDMKSLRYYQIFNAYSMAVMTLATSYRVARNGKSHQDILLTWLLGVGYMLLDDIRQLLAKEI
ncbi:MAG: phosphotransferase family protein [Parasphingorhabdus sp.]|uniref:phosphotransferase family protein n=1 Tax=Parasphingorhabdus sp. TaxID=2709688 RepID=UPI003001F53B